MIGDPTGRDQMRESLTRDQVKKNFETYKEQASKILDFSKIEVAYNHEWLEKLNFSEIVDLASNFTVQQMLERDMFDKRMKDGNPIGLHEFFYPLMVGYDSVVLDVDCELGGNDQYFNMLAGRTLQSAMGKREKFVLTTRLIEGTDGRKMSKTYNNCIYLQDEPREMYGKVMSIKDELIITYMECCTGISMEEVGKFEKELAGGANPRDIKMRLAREIVTLYHSVEDATQAEEAFIKQFSKKEIPDDMPEVSLNKGSYNLVQIMHDAGMDPSKSQIRRNMQQGGVKVEGEKILDIAFEVTVESQPIIIQMGKRRFLKILPK
jgi:tyrosyl-tRNA synthetase